MNLLARLREMAVRAVLSPFGVTRIVNGTPLRVHPVSRHVFAPEYDPGATAYLRRTIRPGSEVWNVGANVGVYVLQLAHWVGPRGRVVAFEPNVAARRLLRRNVRFNHLQERVEIVAAAVGAEEGEAEFFTAGADGMGRAGHPNPQLAHARRTRVPVCTLDAFAGRAGRRPSLVVMDVEGWEIAALAGARALLDTTPFVVELHPDAWQWSGHARTDLESLLAAHDLEAVALSGQRDPLGEHGQAVIAPRQSSAAGSMA